MIVGDHLTSSKKKMTVKYKNPYLMSETNKYVWYANEKLNGLPLIFLIRDIRVRSPLVVRDTRRRHSKLNGQHFTSSSDDLSSKSTKDFPLESFAGRGGGFSSTIHIRFLANPCSSSDPQFPNYYTNLDLIHMSYLCQNF